MADNVLFAEKHRAIVADSVEAIDSNVIDEGAVVRTLIRDLILTGDNHFPSFLLLMETGEEQSGSEALACL